ncbi:hypothetical protein [Streptomyces sp. NPDC008122]|uniref:hypothetical protein n=1 Tax=Streptomyces sp. NPDC008122 TaxID=3364810 RepID=UPI0036F0ED87
MSAAPGPESLLDHRGNRRPTQHMPLDPWQARLGMAFHEAGHAVVAMTYDVHVISSEIIAWSPEPGSFSVTGSTRFHGENVDLWRLAEQCAAGEIAQVQYLRAYGLWTPERAAACAAEHDREYAIDTLAGFGYRLGRDHVPAGGKSWDMVKDLACRQVGRMWREIHTVAHAMTEHTKLTGEQIAAMTGLTNAPLPGGAA